MTSGERRRVRRTERRERRRRFLDRYEQRRRERIANGERVWMRSFRIGAGVTLLILAGLVGWIPGPGGIFFAVPGALLVAGEVRWFAVALDRGEHETVPRIRASWHIFRRHVLRRPDASTHRDAVADVMIAAHRGCHSDAGGGAHENTLLAFERAMDLGVDMVELDVHRTLDGVIVVHHDAHVGRTRIAGSRYADLPQLPGAQCVPTLLEVAQLAAARRAELLVEVKASGCELAAVEQLRMALPDHAFRLFSFHVDVVRNLRRHHPSVAAGLLLDAGNGVDARTVVQAEQATRADFMGLRNELVTDDLLTVAAKRAMIVYVWTINDHQRLQQLMADSRVTTVITDEPAIALDIRRRIVSAGRRA